MSVFKVEIAVIFAREILEACVIIGQYRNVVKVQGWEEARTNSFLRTIWIAAGSAAAVAFFMIVVLGVGLNAAGSELDEKAAEAIEGISKIVASICIAQLSLKIPTWLGLHALEEKKIGVTLTELRFNVAWNIWREIAEIGAFLIPFFLDDDNISAIPLSAFIGLLIGFVAGGIIYAVNRMLTDKRSLAFFMALLTGWLSAGLFTGGCHEIEEVAGETNKVWKIESEALSNKKLPMALLKPFGWAHSPTVLWVVCLVIWATLLVIAHVAKYHLLKKKAAAAASSAAENANQENVQTRSITQNGDASSAAVSTNDEKIESSV